ncbi:hypothetical protein [Actinoplanes sichuanensis]|uniref:Uncharacterized protein n=1 Tax=Actinoplanes sichuanensis TaxID=512349 RepID=A0ABW4AU63_9ACTN|nr:hypothetical protein [Actinoplanes sichuanensis]
MTFVLAAGLQVAAVFFDYRLVPYCGAIAMSALFALAALSPAPAPRRWTHHTALTGLALLTAAAFLADHRTGGFGWSTEVAGGDWGESRFKTPGSALVVEAVLVVAGAAALAAAVLGRVERLLKWRHLPGALIGLFFLALGVDVATSPPLFLGDDIPADPRIRLLVLMPVSLAIAALCVAANAALTTRGMLRPAAAGLLAIIALALIGFNCLSRIEPLQPTEDPVVAEQRRARTEETMAHIDVDALLRAADTSSRVRQDAQPEQEEFGWLPPPTAPEARARALSQDVRRDSGIAAVPYPPSWSAGEADWTRARPAITTALILGGLVLLVMSLFRLPESPPLPAGTGE